MKNFSVPAALQQQRIVTRSLFFLVPDTGPCARVLLGTILKKSPVSSALKMSLGLYGQRISWSLRLSWANDSADGTLAVFPCLVYWRI